MTYQTIMEKRKIIDNLESWVRNITTFLFQWLSKDGEVLGYILAVFHTLGTVLVWVCLFLSHTIYPILWFQVSTFIMLFIIWTQHAILNVCIISVAESVFTSSEPPSEILLNFVYGLLFGTQVEPLKILVFAESGLVLGLALELLEKYFTLNKALSIV